MTTKHLKKKNTLRLTSLNKVKGVAKVNCHFYAFIYDVICCCSKCFI